MLDQNVFKYEHYLNTESSLPVLHYTALHCMALHCAELHCTALHCTALHCTALHCPSLVCTPLYCNTFYSIVWCSFTALHYTAPYCTAHDRWWTTIGILQWRKCIRGMAIMDQNGLTDDVILAVARSNSRRPKSKINIETLNLKKPDDTLYIYFTFFSLQTIFLSAEKGGSYLVITLKKLTPFNFTLQWILNN